MINFNHISQGRSNIVRLSNNSTGTAMQSIPILLERVITYKDLHRKAFRGVSRRTRGRKKPATIGVPSKMSNPKYNKFPLTSKLQEFNLHLNPQGIAHIRPLSSMNQFVTDEAEFDLILHEREFEMHRHKRGPIAKIVKYAKKAVVGAQSKPGYNMKILDIASSPIDTPMNIAKDLPEASLHVLTSSPDMLKIVSDKVVEAHLPNVITELSHLVELSEFDNNSFDLVVSCYGLQNSKDPEKLISEIHRVLKPGGRLIASVWERRGTDAIVDHIRSKVASINTMGLERSKLTKPHILEKMLDESGLRVQDITHGEYPLYLSTVDGLHASAFDIVSRPIKSELVKLMHSGERPYVFEDARAEFDTLVEQGYLVTTDVLGRLVVEDNRYKIISARRQYEDKDREKDIVKMKERMDKASKLGFDQPDIETVKRMVSGFNNLLIDTLPRVPNSPWKYLVDSVEKDMVASGHSVSKSIDADSKSMAASHYSLLDLASYPNYSTRLLAESIPNISIHSVGLSPEGKADMTQFAEDNHFDNITTYDISSDDRQLKDFDNASMDAVTCSFGLTRFSNPDLILQEVHRVLKPGGSFIATTWDSISLERIGEQILSRVLVDKKPHILAPISNLSSFSPPRKLERLIESYGKLDIQKVDHIEFPFELGDDEATAFDKAIIPIHHLLKRLEETGLNPKAFDDAKRVYQQMIQENDLMWKNENGKVKTVRNRYKFLLARRKFEAADGILESTDL